MQKQRLIVIGAGFAGLAAARTILGAAGDRVEVIVLEAQDAVGGRARKGTLPSGVPVELGATWFHGICGNPLYEIAVWEGLVHDLRGDPGLRRHHINWKVDFARPLCPELLSGRLKDIAEEALDSFQEGAMEQSRNQPAADRSVGDLLRCSFDEAVRSHRLCEEELSVFAESWLFREKQQRSFDGFFCTDDVSSIFPWEFESLEGPNMAVPGGFQAIAESLASVLDIRFGHVVTEIEWGSGGVSISCKNGAVLEADAVLVTTSIGVLQAQHMTMFQPLLPDWKQVALNAVRLGVADKLFVEFELEEPGEPAGSRSSSSDAASGPLPSIACGDGLAGPMADAWISGSASGLDQLPGSAPQSSSSWPQAAGTEYEDPWNMGRRGATEVKELTAAAAQAASGALTVGGAAAAAAAVQEMLGARGAGGAGEGGRPRRPRREQKEVRTFAFMWPVPEPMLLGSAGSAGAKALLPGGLPHEPVPGMLLSDLPPWLYGLHSIRFSPGPDFIEPSDEARFLESQQGSQAPKAAGKKTASAVLWITGDAALEMERLSDEEVQQGITQLLHTFSSIPLPAGAKRSNPRVVRTRWGMNELFRGSYSYLRHGVDGGDAVDVIAEPLVAEDGMPVVMFAGEATHRHYMGTVHGAYMSGFREASRFLAALEHQDSVLAWSQL